MAKEQYIIGVDVGSGSARAGIFDVAGHLLAHAAEPIQTWRPRPDHVEQSSEDIWRAVCVTVRACRESAEIAPEEVAGIGFDAACSLVTLDKNDQPLAINEEGDAQRNVIVWMDHRAVKETEAINAGAHDVLQYVGGRLSPEMQTPKLKWLKENLPDAWKNAGKFLDLSDFLTYRATGNDARSICSVVCKWTYLGHEGDSGKWDQKYFQSIGLEDIFEHHKIGDVISPIGGCLGNLTAQAAAELGLSTTCAVSAGIIDAHAGGLGLLGMMWQGEKNQPLEKLESALALICGTSNCHMAVSREPQFINGVWGPYRNAMIPDMWLNEGGQSTAGSAIDYVITSHANAPALFDEARQQNKTVYELLNAEVQRLQSEQGKSPEITRDHHVLPYFLGNRSPYADPGARAMIEGITLDQSITSQALHYYASIQAVAYGTRDIISAMNDAGYNIKKLLVTGGSAKNQLWLQEHADATGCTMVLPEEPEAVLLGSAIMAAAACGIYDTIYQAMAAMSRAGKTIEPRLETSAYHNAKFKIFRELYQQQQSRKDLMAAFS